MCYYYAVDTWIRFYVVYERSTAFDIITFIGVVRRWRVAAREWKSRRPDVQDVERRGMTYDGGDAASCLLASKTRASE